MAFIKVQGLTRDSEGNVLSGTASLVDTVYVKEGKYHSKQVIRERLGRVVEFDNGKRKGVFMSPTRGLVFYDCDTDVFTPIDPKTSPENMMAAGAPVPECPAAPHKTFGDSFFMLKSMKKAGLTDLLASFVPDVEDRKVVLSDMVFNTLKPGYDESMDSFMSRNFASSVLDVKSHTSEEMLVKFGKNLTKATFFNNLKGYMSADVPDYGSTAQLDVIESGSKAFILVLDHKSGIPLWFDNVEGPVMEAVDNTVKFMKKEFDSTVVSLYLDPVYLSRDAVTYENIAQSHGIGMVAMSPSGKDFRHRELFNGVKSSLDGNPTMFSLNGKKYFTKSLRTSIFGKPEYAYVYIDYDNAKVGLENYLRTDREGYEALKGRDRAWIQYMFGYFVLFSNVSMEPGQMLNEYLVRTSSDDLVRKVMVSSDSDDAMMYEIFRSVVRNKVFGCFKDFSYLGTLRACTCCIDGTTVSVDPCDAPIKKVFSKAGITVPRSVNLAKFEKELGLE